MRRLPNRSTLNGLALEGSDGTSQPNFKPRLRGNADWRWLVFTPKRFANGCSTSWLSWARWNNGRSDDGVWGVLALGGLYQATPKG